MWLLLSRVPGREGDCLLVGEQLVPLKWFVGFCYILGKVLLNFNYCDYDLLI
jgi:hypothetical protein